MKIARTSAGPPSLTISSRFRPQYRPAFVPNIVPLSQFTNIGPVPLSVPLSSAETFLRIRDHFRTEQDDGFVIVASEDESLAYFQQKLTEFIGTVGGPIKGSAGIAKIHELREDLTSEERLQRILTERLFAELPQLDTDAPYVVDVSISCQGNWILPRKPKRGRRTDKTWAKKEADWSQARNKAYEQWDRLKDERLGTVEHFIEFYHGEITGDAAPNSDVPPDYFELRARLPGAASKT